MNKVFNVIKEYRVTIVTLFLFLIGIFLFLADKEPQQETTKEDLYAQLQHEKDIIVAQRDEAILSARIERMHLQSKVDSIRAKDSLTIKSLKIRNEKLNSMLVTVTNYSVSTLDSIITNAKYRQLPED